MDEALSKYLTPWADVKKTMENPPEDPKMEEYWKDMNNYVLNFVLSLLM